MADQTDEKDEAQDVSAYLGVDPIYMNYSDERNQPFRAEEVDEDDENAVQSNAEVVSTEDVAYSHQEWTREDAGQDPTTGEPLDIDPAEQLRQKREQYKDPNWGPNMPHAMTGEAEGSATDTGSTETVKSDGTTGESVKSDGDTTGTPSAPAAPKAAAKKTASPDNK